MTLSANKLLRQLTYFGTILLAGCANFNASECAAVASYIVPDEQQDLFPVMITHIDGEPVIAKAYYVLTPGVYKVTVAELVSAPSLQVALKYRLPKTIEVNVLGGSRYHLAAWFDSKMHQPAESDNFWQPIMWKKESFSCELNT
ncbi:hypothetical protein D5R81_19500 [Parashewanella spongiae]|uniref:Lipoprotein n=1 Tax=Parashewanella spongiae TaxID=342950 RepID=A0A3A6TB07_9GAMM|nr:hypothetical protein [Parashewanella spongiae]MCL1080227.1 hypothetical protein [Parashewanella spongiae]RJY02155.1 hypothetical protein D5R81_19500 [Parashewanella spongiae]